MKNSLWGRREMLKKSGLLAVGAPFIKSRLNSRGEIQPLGLPSTQEGKKPDRPIAAVVLGAGNRGNVYAGYSLKFPEELKIVGVAEPIELRRKRFSAKYQIPEKYQWVTWEHALPVHSADGRER